jgi:acylpyruvate hydrolase
LKLANFEAAGSVRAGILKGQYIYDVAQVADTAAISSVDQILKERLLELVRQSERRILAGEGTPIEAVKLKKPVLSPKETISVTADDETQGRQRIANRLVHPRFWIRSNYSLLDPGAVLFTPRSRRQLELEVGLGIVIGKNGEKIRASEAYSCVAGYSVCNETSFLESQTGNTSPVAEGPTKVKSIDAPLSLGPWLVTRDEIPEPHNLGISIGVNGTQRAYSNTSRLRITVDALVCYASMATPLHPGDIISTAGVQEFADPSRWPTLRDGDLFEAKIDGIGVLSNTVGVSRLAHS